MMESRRALVTAFDENYLMPGLLAAITALRNSPEDVRLFILGTGLSDGARAQIHQIVPAGRSTIIDASHFVDALTGWSHISKAAWGRIGIGTFLPPEVERVVYVDADTMTRSELTPLFDLDLNGKVLAACIDRPMPTHRARHLWGKGEHSDLDYGSDCPVPEVISYFNSGVLAIDLDSWRERDVEAKVMQYASALPSSYLLLDQDVLNSVLWEDWLLLDWKQWNWPGYYKDPLAWETHVVHFISTPKPWVGYPLGAPFAREYLKASAGIGWDPKPTRVRIMSGLIEAVVPNSIVVRRKRISRAVRSRLQIGTR